MFVLNAIGLYPPHRVRCQGVRIPNAVFRFRTLWLHRPRGRQAGTVFNFFGGLRRYVNTNLRMAVSTFHVELAFDRYAALVQV